MASGTRGSADGRTVPDAGVLVGGQCVSRASGDGESAVKALSPPVSHL